MQWNKSIKVLSSLGLKREREESFVSQEKTQGLFLLSGLFLWMFEVGVSGLLSRRESPRESS